MKRKCGLLALVILNSFTVFSQQVVLKEDSILWDKNIRLKWSDFTGRPDTFSEGTAGCAASIYVKGFRDNGLPNFLVTNSFIKNDAWTKDTTSVILLRHEQLHFDIAEVYARKIRKAVDSLRKANVIDIGPYSEEIQRLLKERNETDSLYDEQTAHGVYGNEQSVWNEKILKELESLSEYIYFKSVPP
jgi:hypothetical protein